MVVVVVGPGVVVVVGDSEIKLRSRDQSFNKQASS